MVLYCRKHCVQSYNVFDFLKDIVSRVPDYSHGHGHGHGHADAGEDRIHSKRRLVFLCFALIFFLFPSLKATNCKWSSPFVSRKTSGDEESDEESRRNRMVSCSSSPMA